MSASSDWVERVDRLDREAFFGEFVAQRRPVVIRRLTSGWHALQWGSRRFQGPRFANALSVKRGNVSEGRRESMSLSAYVALLDVYEEQLRAGEQPVSPGYMHDVPLFHIFPFLRGDVEPFPRQLLPKWYSQEWPAFAQAFIGPTGSVTPLHFDTLLTHNLFFHLVGRKRFILIPADQRARCYTAGWRWARFDPSAPDYDAFPRAAGVTPSSIVLEPGEILYMPPGTLHHVTNLSQTISFNIDWHTAHSALRGVASVARGAPLTNGYYNLICLLGVGLRIPTRYLFPLYQSYLSYVS